MMENTESSIYFIKKSFELKNLKLYKEAIEMLYKALSCDDLAGDKNIEIIAQIGDLYYLLKNYERAIEQYEKVLDKNNSHIHSLHKLCEIYFILQNYTKALEIAKDLCKKAKSVENHINYFKVLFKLNLFDEIKILLSYSGNLNSDIYLSFLLSGISGNVFLMVSIISSEIFINDKSGSGKYL